jgi:hypothetical protein
VNDIIFSDEVFMFAPWFEVSILLTYSSGDGNVPFQPRRDYK